MRPSWLLSGLMLPGWLLIMLMLAPAAGFAADPSALWNIVHGKCVPHEQAAADPSPCAAVDPCMTDGTLNTPIPATGGGVPAGKDGNCGTGGIFGCCAGA